MNQVTYEYNGKTYKSELFHGNEELEIELENALLRFTYEVKLIGWRKLPGGYTKAYKTDLIYANKQWWDLAIYG